MAGLRCAAQLDGVSARIAHVVRRAVALGADFPDFNAEKNEMRAKRSRIVRRDRKLDVIDVASACYFRPRPGTLGGADIDETDVGRPGRELDHSVLRYPHFNQAAGDVFVEGHRLLEIDG